MDETVDAWRGGKLGSTPREITQRDYEPVICLWVINIESERKRIAARLLSDAYLLWVLASSAMLSAK